MKRWKEVSRIILVKLKEEEEEMDKTLRKTTTQALTNEPTYF